MGAGAALGTAKGRRSDNADINKWVGPVSKDLQANRGASIVIAGECQPPAVHALAAMINEKLGNTGKTVFYTDPIEANPVDQVASLTIW